NNMHDHQQRLHVLFQHFQQYGVVIHSIKCIFGVSEIDYLEHHITTHGVTTLADRVQALISYPEPDFFQRLRRFMGMCNFYRRFVPHCAHLLQTLNDLLKGRQKIFHFSQEARTSFNAIKEVLARVTMLTHLDPNPSSQLVLCTDAFKLAVGAVLQQQQKDGLVPLAFFSKRLEPSQTRYSTLDIELLAIEARQLDYISQLTTDIRFIKGDVNVVADTLSRRELNA
ncbi:Transposon Tf2-9 polyprotein, partial [Schistosoma japonicum]